MYREHAVVVVDSTRLVVDGFASREEIGTVVPRTL